MIRNVVHHCLVVTGQNKELMKEVRNKSIEFFKINMEAGFGYKLVGEIQESLINHFYTMVIFPDGSKEGHETSDDGDVVRKKIVEYLDSINKTSGDHLSYIEVFYGTDENDAGILKSDKGTSSKI